MLMVYDDEKFEFTRPWYLLIKNKNIPPYSTSVNFILNNIVIYGIKSFVIIWKKNSNEYSLLLVASCIFSRIFTNALWVDSFFLKPNWFLSNNWCLFKYVINLEWMSFSMVNCVKTPLVYGLKNKDFLKWVEWVYTRVTEYFLSDKFITKRETGDVQFIHCFYQIVRIRNHIIWINKLQLKFNVWSWNLV